MITFLDASNTTPHFRNVCKKSMGLLRFCSIVNIVSLKSSTDDLRAEILASISALSAKFKLCADIMIKEQESELYPLFDDIISIILETSAPADKCMTTVSLAEDRVKEMVRKKISTADSGITITDYENEVKKYAGESVFRDAESIYDILGVVSELNTERNNLAEKIKQLKSISVRFINKHYNIALDFKSSIEELVFKYTELVAVSDACDVALEVNSAYEQNHEAIMLLLDNNTEYVINVIKNMYMEKLKV